MIVTIRNKQKDLSLSAASAKKILIFLTKMLKVSTDEIIVHFVNKTEITRIHGEFFADPTPTDCMSFPIDPPNTETQGHRILGEIFVCPRVALEYAEENGSDPYEETTLYMIHGFLHLLGYDDLTPGPRKKMRFMEKKCITAIHEFSLKSGKKRLS